MTKRDDYVRKMHAKLDEWNSDLDRLMAKADLVKVQARAEYQKQIQDLRLKCDDAGKKLEEVKRAREDAWEDLKDGLERASKALGEAFESAKSRFKYPEEIRR
jgi:predicted  nucleic acid-binding Zn-ribbon protein